MKNDAKFWKELYEEMKEQYEELEAAINMAVDTITITDGNGLFVKVNDSSAMKMGLKKEEIIGKSGFELEDMGIFDVSATAEVVRRQQKVRFIQKTKANRIVLVTGNPIFDENNKIIKIINIGYDITEKKSLERQLSETESTLQWFKNEVQLRSSNKTYIGTENKNMATIKELLDSFAYKDILIMLLGDTGVGKSFTANYIHNISLRKNPLYQLTVVLFLSS